MRKRMQSKKRKLLPAMLAVALAAVMIVPMGSGIAKAAEGDGTITLNVQSGSDDYGVFGEDLADNADVAYFLIAEGVKDTSYDTYNWTLVEPFNTEELAALLQAAQPKNEDKSVNQKAYEDMAQAALNIILNDSEGAITPAATAKIGDKSSTPSAGFYLVVPRQLDGEEAKIVEKDGVVTVTTDEFIYSFLPTLISVPTKAEKDGSRETSFDYGDWITDVQIVTKASRVPNVGSIQIEKALDLREGKAEAATFIFSVTATKNNETVYDNVVSISYPNPVPVRIDNLPVGATVTIDEIYTSPSYRYVSGLKNIVIDAEPDDEVVTQIVTVSNTYNENHYHGGGGIENQYANTDNATGGKTWQFIGRIINGVKEVTTEAEKAGE